MTTGISIVGMACCYPDAGNPRELWENILSQRRAFRRLPSERLRLADYFSKDRKAPDSLYSTNAAVIKGYEFDRLNFRVAGSTFRSADLSHWLALDVASQALEDAGFAGAKDLPRDAVGVFLGNTLTGEFSRANALRLRWPYVRRTLESALRNEDWSSEQLDTFLSTLEKAYKKPFPPIGEESLAGGLSNTIAGRICNYFDFRGGGYTVDAACASSLVAVANACSALAAGDLDVVLAGGVDLSLDPFELVGFAKAGALATDEMRVYDEESNGFWPGEGCGFAVLMRSEDAAARNLRVYARIKGWAISSDGHGGITRPGIEGQLLALRRAYARAGFGIDTTAYFEGHGTGTSVGDTVELQALSRARREAKDNVSPAAIGTIKANIGHTKAAAGIAGLIKATLALSTGIIPPTTGCSRPHSELSGESAALRAVKKAELWPHDQKLRVGVSAMGFGGINAHVVLEADEPETRTRIDARTRSLIHSAQDAELFLLGAQSHGELQNNIDRLLSLAGDLSQAELSDLAAHLAGTLNSRQVRAAVVAATPSGLVKCLERLRSVVAEGAGEIDAKRGVFFSATSTMPRLGFLFPGQGSPSHLDGGALRRRFDLVDQLYSQAQLNADGDATATATAQPAIVTASIAALRLMSSLNITAQIGVGHSLGELTALHWGGALGEEALLRTAKARGLAMTGAKIPAGAMASLAAAAQRVQALLNGEGVCIAALNSLRQTVISGPIDSVDKIMARAREQGLEATKLPVSLAFHSQLVAFAAHTFEAHLAGEQFKLLRRKVISTVTGKQILAKANLRELLYQQITSPVLFLEAVSQANSHEIDLWFEVGSGHVLGRIMSDITETPCISLDAGGESLRGLLNATGAAYVLGQPINHGALFAGRFTRAFDLERRPKFFANPCELAPVSETTASRAAEDVEPLGTGEQEIDPAAIVHPSQRSIVELVSQMVAKRAELPASAVDPESRLLSDLHLNSITVSQLIVEAARVLNLTPPLSLTSLADARIVEVAQALEEQRTIDPALQAEAEGLPAGVDSWVRAFTVELSERALAAQPQLDEPGHWQVISAPDDKFAEALRRQLDAGEAGNGIIVCLPPETDESVVSSLLPAARLALTAKDKTKFVLVQQGRGAAAFARTLHAEAPHVTTCVVRVPQSHATAVDWVIAETRAAQGYVEASYDNTGRRYEPVIRSLPFLSSSGALPLSNEDLLIVTGGGKGITAECALALAKESGARFVLIGQAHPDADEELSANLKRFAAARVDFRYIPADVTNELLVRNLVQTIETELGPITGILHGAARNVPQLLHTLDEQSFRKTLAVKVQGARNLLAAVNPEKLRLLVTFGSIIAQTGLPGEADYGLANEWLTHLTEEWQTAHPSCRCLAVEWSVWSGMGMGERLGRTRLMQQGITPISPEHGVEVLRSLLVQPSPPASVIVMGRFRDLPTFKIERPELPLRRFLEQPRVYYPGVELVADVNLSADSDPYLNDHQFQGQSLLPAVMGLEAMAQAAMALAGSDKPPVFEQVSFNQPVTVPAMKTLKVRIAALTCGPGEIAVALRSEETGFQVDHFQARCNFADVEPDSRELLPERFPSGDQLALDVQRDLYGNILFHTGRFCRLSNYRRLSAKECIAEIKGGESDSWFSRYLPSALVLGDPGARDAAVHAIQACIPQATILPTGIEKLTIYQPGFSGPVFVHARERSASGNSFVYDVSVTHADGSLRERWEGLQLAAVGSRPAGDRWVAPLLGPYLERRVNELILTADLTVAIVQDDELDRQKRGALAYARLLGADAVILKRPDGKPEVVDGSQVSATHHDNLTLAVAGPESLGCDLEEVVFRPPDTWRALIGDAGIALVQLLQRKADENGETSATRVWAARECLKKAGAMVNAPLVFQSATADGWVILSSGRFNIATCALQLRNHESNFVIALLAGTRQLANTGAGEKLNQEVVHASL